MNATHPIPNGTYTRDDLSRMTWPVAWSGTVCEEDRKKAEAAISAAVREAIEAIDEAETYHESEDGEPEELAAKFTDGEFEIVVAE